MAYNEKLAERLREALAGEPGISERKMFGGIAFMHHGNMVCGIIGSDLMVRVGPDLYDDALARPHSGLMEFTGRPMKGMVLVEAEGIRAAAVLRSWTDLGMQFARTLPPK